MLDDPFSLPLPSARPFAGPRSSLGSTSTTASFRLAATEQAKHEAPYSLLLSGNASKYKSSAMTGPPTFAAGKENALLPSPRFGSSTTAASSSSSSSSAAASSSPAREGTDLLRKSFKPSLKRRVTFSPTPLASLQSSPSHTKRTRPDYLTGGLLFSDEHERAAKRARRRENVYSDNPLLEAARGTNDIGGEEGLFARPQLVAAGSDPASDSDVRAGGSSSPATSTSPKRPLLPRSPPRSRRSIPTTYHWDDQIAMSGLVPRTFPWQPAIAAAKEELVSLDKVDGTAEGDDMTDSEEESEQVESLLLPSPEKRASASFVPSPSLSAGVGPFASILSSVDPAIAAPVAPSSSSPLKSPSLALVKTPRPSTSLLVPAVLPLRSILKQRPFAPNCLVKDEREGLRKNGRGRRHVVGWDTENKSKLARQRKRDEQTAMKNASEEVREAEASGGSGKGKGKAKESEGDATSKPSTSRETRSSSRVAKGSTSRPFTSTSRGAGQDEDDDLPRRRRNGDASRPAPIASSSASISGGKGPTGRRRPKEPKGQAALDDPTWFRSPLLVLRASVRDCRDGAAARLARDGSMQSILPRPHAAASPSSAATTPDAPPALCLGNVTTLSDVEDAYVSLKNAVYCMPDELVDAERTLQPVKTHADELISSMIRDIGNVRTFPVWVAEQPIPRQRIGDIDDQMQIDEQGGEGLNVDDPSSSPTRTRPASHTTTSPTKLSLNETQMSRMRDELSTALAAIKCASIMFKDERTVALFDPSDVAKVIDEIASIASTPGLSVSVRREISPFLPFFFASVSNSAATILAPLLATSVLPALRQTLSLEPRIDRYRTAVSESLDALVELLCDHGCAMLGQDAWQLWLPAATMGLWDGSKKMVSTCDRALKVLGRVAHLLTETLPITDPWRTDRRAAHQAISNALKELFTSSPPDAPLDKHNKSGGQLRMTYIRLMMDQLEKEAESTQGGDEEAMHRSLSTLSALSIVPVLLNRHFRRIARNGIGPWLRPFNNVSTSASDTVLALSALSWPHMAYAFLSVEPVGVSKTPWLFHKPLTFVHYLKIFDSRSERWDRAPDPKADATKQEQICLHAEALAMAFAAVVYGATVCVQQAAVRRSPRQENNDFLARIFDDALLQYLPKIAHSPVSDNVNALGWKILSSLCRPEPADVEAASVDALVNTDLLDGNMATLLPSSGALNALLARAMQRAVRPEVIPGWGEAWLSSHIARMLSLFRDCQPPAGTISQELQIDIVRAWTNLLDTVARQPAAVSELVAEIVKLSTGRPDVGRLLWTALFDKHNAIVEETVEAALRADAHAYALAARCWLESPAPSAVWAEPLVRITKSRLAQNLSKADTKDTLELAVELLQQQIQLLSLDALGAGQNGLAQAIGHAAWHKDTTANWLVQKMASRTDAVETSLRLCIELVAGMRSLDNDAQLRGLRVCESAFDQVFSEGQERAKGCLEAIDKLLQSASDAAYPTVYEAFLSRLSTVIAITTADLVLFADTLAGPLRRSLEQLSSAVGTSETQLAESMLARVPSYTLPLQTFQNFWQATFGASQAAYEIPASLAEPLKILTSISEGFSVSGYEETLPVANESLPVAGQGMEIRTKSTTDRSASAQGYDADVSRQPLVQLSDATADPSSKPATRSTARKAAYSPSLRMPTESLARAGAPIEGGSADVVIGETPDDVQAEKVQRSMQQSYADLSRQLRPRSASRSTESAEVAPRRKRIRTTTGSSDGRSSADDSGAEIVSSGRRRVGKRFRDKAKSARAAATNGSAAATEVPTSPAAADRQRDARSTEPPSSLTQNAREEELVRGFLDLPFETVVQVGRRIGGSPSLRRLIDLGDKAREYFQGFGSP